MSKCSFCGEVLRKGTGKMFVHTDGRISYFCSSKCERNTRKLRRNPATTVWTKKYQDIKRGSEAKPEQKEAKKEQKQEKAAKGEKKQEKK